MDGKPLNQKTINRRVINVLHGMRSQGAVIQMKKGDWPRTIEKKVEAYQPEELSHLFCGLRPEGAGDLSNLPVHWIPGAGDRQSGMVGHRSQEIGGSR